MREVVGEPSAEGLHVGVVAARWNQPITERLLEGALDALEEAGATEVTVLRVPGALEIPLGAKSLIDMGCDAVVAIGVVVKGETDHYEIVVRESTGGLSRIILDTGVPIGNALLAVHDAEDAYGRSGPGGSNKGREAALAAVEMAKAIRSL